MFINRFDGGVATGTAAPTWYPIFCLAAADYLRYAQKQ
jgi:hypothetical protein